MWSCPVCIWNAKNLSPNLACCAVTRGCLQGGKRLTK